MNRVDESALYYPLSHFMLSGLHKRLQSENKLNFLREEAFGKSFVKLIIEYQKFP